MRYECEKVRALVRDAIKQFFLEEQCFKNKFCIDATIGVTVDEHGMFYVSLNEVIDRDNLKPESLSHSHSQDARPKKRSWSSQNNPGVLDMECSGAGPSATKKAAKLSKNMSETPDAPLPLKTECDDDDFDDDDSSQGSPADSAKGDDDHVVIKQELDDSWFAHEDDDMQKDDSSLSNYPPFSDNPADDSQNTGEGDWSKESGLYSQMLKNAQASSTITSEAGGDTAGPSGSHLPQSYPEGYTGPLPYIVPAIPRQRESRCALPLIKKVELIQMSKGITQKKLAQMYGVSKTQVNAILRRKDEILAAYSGGARPSKKMITDRPSKNHDINMMTWTWYKDMMAANMTVSGTQIQRQAMYFAELLGKDTFKASNGWLHSFKQRHEINVSNTTSTEGDSHKDDSFSVNPECLDTLRSASDNPETPGGEIFSVIDSPQKKSTEAATHTKKQNPEMSGEKQQHHESVTTTENPSNTTGSIIKGDTKQDSEQMNIPCATTSHAMNSAIGQFGQIRPQYGMELYNMSKWLFPPNSSATGSLDYSGISTSSSYSHGSHMPLLDNTTRSSSIQGFSHPVNRGFDAMAPMLSTPIGANNMPVFPSTSDVLTPVFPTSNPPVLSAPSSFVESVSNRDQQRLPTNESEQ